MNKDESIRKNGSSVKSNIQQEALGPVETNDSTADMEQDRGTSMRNVDNGFPSGHIEESLSSVAPRPRGYHSTQFLTQEETISESESKPISYKQACVELSKQGSTNEVSIQWGSKQNSRKTLVYQAVPAFSPRNPKVDALEKTIDDRLLTATRLVATVPCKTRMFDELLKQSPVTAADFEFRNENVFLKVLEQIESSEKHYFAENSMVMRLDLFQVSQLESKMAQEAWYGAFTKFKQIAIVTSVSDIVNACHWLQVCHSGKKCLSPTLFLWAQYKGNCQVLNALFREFDPIYLYVNLHILKEKGVDSLFYQKLNDCKHLHCLVVNDMTISLRELDNILKCSSSVFVGYLSSKMISKELEKVKVSLQNNMKEVHLITSELCYHLQQTPNNDFKEYWSFSKDFGTRLCFYPDKVKLEFACKALQANSTLEILDIDSCNMNSDDAKKLSEALKRNSTLDNLCIGINKINSEGARYIADVLKMNSTLTKLSIYGNNIGSEGARYLSEALKVNSTLKMLCMGRNNIGSEGTKYISNALMHNSTLTELCIYGNNIDSQGAKYLSEALKVNSGLKTFRLGRNSIGSEGAMVLSKALERNSTLTELYIYANKIGPEGAKHLFGAMERHSKLTTLCIGINNIGPDGAKALSEALQRNSSLETLQLYANEIGSQGMKYLSEALEINSALTTFLIGCNDIGNEGAGHLSEALKTNSTLKVLYIYGNNIDATGARYLSDMLRRNLSLIKMHIYGNSIGSEGFNALVEGLKENYTMKELYINIKDDSIGSRETSLIRELLHRNNCLSDEVDSPISFTQEEEQMIMERRKKLDLPTQQDHDAACKAAFLLISYLQHRRKLCLIDSNEPNNASPSDSLLKPLFLMDPTDLPNVRAQEECFLSETHSYRCGICSFVCLYPCCSDNCSHIFCKVCITRRLDENKSCPLCETPCESWRQVPVIDSMIRHLIVDCPLKCGWQGLLSVYDNCHQMECIHQKGRCNLCGLEMELGQFTNIHLVESDCRIPCRYCNQVIGAPLMEVHEHYECLLAPFQCSLCQKILTWKDSLNHSNTCCGSIPAFMVHVEGDLVSDTCV